MQTKIETWPDIAHGFYESVVLGNGASIAASPKFSYKSLLTQARSARRLSPGVESLFSRLATSDFELALEMLWHAQMVNECLAIPAVATAVEYQNLRAALIATVREHHATYEEVRPALVPVHDFLRGFSTVISLNYDLLVYWSILEENEKRGTCFKDAFVHGVSSDN